MTTAGQGCALGAGPRTAAAPLHQTMAIEHGMNGAFDGEFAIGGEAAQRPVWPFAVDLSRPKWPSASFCLVCALVTQLWVPLPSRKGLVVLAHLGQLAERSS
jgi:hypothetical protein